MALTTTLTLPVAPYAGAPYAINENWCIGDSLNVINANFDYFQVNKVAKAGDTMTGNLVMNAASINVTNGGGVDINNGKLNHFCVDINSVSITPGTTNQAYQILPTDCGKVILVSATVNCYITVPAGLPTGFSVMIVSKTSYNVNIAPVAGTGVLIKNVNNYQSIAGAWGICNLVIVEPNTALISGDLN